MTTPEFKEWLKDYLYDIFMASHRSGNKFLEQVAINIRKELYNIKDNEVGISDIPLHNTETGKVEEHQCSCKGMWTSDNTWTPKTQSGIETQSPPKFSGGRYA